MTELVTLLPWDSAFFGRRIGRVLPTRLRADTWAAAAAQAGRLRVECLYLLAEADDAATVAIAEAAGFALHDIRVTYGRDVGPGLAAPALPHPASVRPAEPGDAPALAAIARRSHAESRFYADARLAPRAPELYATWLDKSLGGEADAVLALCWAGEPSGYLTCHVADGVGQIGLVAVGEALRGRGMGLALVGCALSWFAARGARRVTVVTQGRNRAAQRLYQRAGFLTDSVQLWYHRWLDHGGAPAGDPTQEAHR